MKANHTISFIVIWFCFLPLFSYSQKPAKQTWVAKSIFQRNVFIENKGQFSPEEQQAVGDKILFFSRKGSLYLYFSKNSLTFRYDSAYQAGNGEETEPENVKVKHVFMKMAWEGANKNTQLETRHQVSDYFSYGNPKDKSGKTSIKANGFTALIYHNLYPGIDVRYYYPDNKDGLEYDIIVHPGASLASVKMHYSNALLILLNTILHINSACGNITDHAPLAKDEKGNNVNVSFCLNKNEVSFTSEDYDKARTLTIDPWYTSLSFSSVNKAYDLGYDLQGNVYVYGGQNNFQLQKYNSNGVLQWTYTAAFTFSFDPLFNFYGDVTVDTRSGTSYISEGYDTLGAKVIKVSSSGIQQAIFAGSNLVTEFWRMNFDDCHNMLVIATGNTTASGIQACTLDTNLTRLDTANVLGTIVGGHDMALLGLDGRGSCYMATAHNFYSNDTTYNNVLCRVPLPSLKPSVFKIHDKYNFSEASSVKYYPGYGPPQIRSYAGNGFNGLAANPQMVIMYDGSTLKKWRTSGTLADSIHVSAYNMRWGGLELDCEGHVYAGNATQINVYDSSLNLLTTLSLPDTVFDLAVGINQQVYACGNGYVASVTAPTVSNISSISFTYPTSCTVCNGTATANPACGLPPYTYHWSNGATTQTITGLCAGLYTVTVTDGTCPPWEDTAVVSIPGKPGFYATLTDSNPTCRKKGSVTANPTGGTPPYTYLWSNGETAQKDTGLVAGTYSLTVTDAGGCSFYISTILSSHIPLLATYPKNDNLCIGSALPITVSGAATYSWQPAANLSCGNCPNPVASPTANTTYTVTGIDSNGCSATATVTLWVHPLPVIALAPPNDTVCFGGSGQLSASGAMNYTWSPSTYLSCYLCPYPVVYPTHPITYTVIGTDINGCVDSTVCHVTLGPKPKGTVTTPITVCKDSSVTLTAGGGTSYVWNTGATTSSIIVNPTVSTIYTVAVKNGCVDSVKAYVYIDFPGGVACCNTTIIRGTHTMLSVSPQAAGYTYHWYPSTDLSCTSCPSPYASPTVTTTYYVIITDNNGCAKTDSVIIEVKPPCPEIFVPDAFSPNNDGENDILFVRGGCIASLFFEVFDRWGNKVFETNDINDGWNGKFNSQPMNTGTYVYFLKATLNDGSHVEKRGNVALVR